MAYVNTTRGDMRPSLAADILLAFKAAIVRRQLYTRTFSELRSLSDRELADLGLARSSIAAVAREAAYGK